MERREPWLTSRNAYLIFRGEIKSILAWVRTMLAQDLRSASPEGLKRLRTEMHKIKGGAGFFGLDDVAKLAADFESQLLLASPPLSDRLNKLTALLADLEQAASALPEPPEQPKS